MPVRPKRAAWLEGTFIAKTRTPAARKTIPGEWEVMHRTLSEAQHDGGDHRTPDLRHPIRSRLWCPVSAAAVRTVAETDAAAANRATVIPATGIVLRIVRIVKSGRLTGC